MFGTFRRLPARRILPVLLMLIGTALLAYSSIQYGRMYFAQKRLAREWQRQNQIQQQRQQLDPPSGTSSDEPRLIRLLVPRIQLDSVVVEGVSNKALLLGPGHMNESPVPGELGNSVITAHRDTFFRHIHELQGGDELIVQRDGRTYHFEVTGKKVVEPTDVSVIRPTKDSRLTLITCYPTYYIGPAPKRLVVFSRLLSSSDQKRAGTSGENPETMAAHSAAH